MNTKTTPPRAFTLVEVLTVVAIIGIVIAVLVPALAGARNVARKTASQALLVDVSNAALRFEADNQRPPGYFTPNDMGNNTTGLTAMENVMLDLAGGIVANGAPGNRILQGIRPSFLTEPISVDLDRIGIETPDNPGYFVPPARSFTNGPEDDGTFNGWDIDGGNGQVTPGGGNAGNEYRQLPELVDAFGQPILAWVRDPIAKQRGVPTNITEFAAQDASGGTFAYFYWASNAGFLESQSLGRLGEDQFDSDTAGRAASLMNVDDQGAALDPLGRAEAAAALLGNTSFPTLDINDGGTTDQPGTITNLIPAAARGSMVFHSAGADGIYLSANDEGAGRIAGQFRYWKNFFPGLNAGNRYQDADGNPTNIDITEEFDDLIVAAGG